jgi:hypothetical protein
MRYIIETENEDVKNLIDRMKTEGRIEIIEEAEPMKIIEPILQKIAKSLEYLQNAGYNPEIMEIYLVKKTGLTLGKIRSVLTSQSDFFNAIGVKI